MLNVPHSIAVVYYRNHRKKGAHTHTYTHKLIPKSNQLHNNPIDVQLLFFKIIFVSFSFHSQLYEFQYRRIGAYTQLSH